MRIRTLLAYGLFSSAASGCALDSTAEDSAIQEKSQHFYYNPSWIWDDPELSVCWVEPRSETATERAWVRNAVEMAFEPDTAIDFTGWGACTSAGADIEIAVSDTFPPEAAIGTSPGFATGEDMRLNFFEGQQAPPTPPTQPPISSTLDDCWAGSAVGQQPTTGDIGVKYWSTNRQRCIETIAVHEFLHAVGLRHEQRSPLLNVQSCGPKEELLEGHATLGFWDLLSASNYCNPSYRGETILSPLDVSGLIELYGAPTDDQLWTGYGNIRDLAGVPRDALLFERQNFNLSGTYRPLVGDYNGDGADDIFWDKPGAGTEMVYFGGWGSGFLIRTFDQPLSRQPAVADFNGDGYDDVLWHTAWSGQNDIWYGNQNRSFDVVGVPSMPGNYDHKPYAGDFDGDGFGDIFWDGQGGNSDRMWYGSSQGFDESYVYYPNAKPIVGDFDGDGQDDIYLHTAGAPSVWLAYSNGRGTPTFESIDTTQVTDADAVTSGDLDGDGISDLLISTPGITDFVWLFKSQRGFRHYSMTSSVLAGPHGNAVPLAGDYNGDGIGDVFWFSR